MKCELGKCFQYTRVPGYETGSADACTCVSIRRRSERYIWGPVREPVRSQRIGEKGVTRVRVAIPNRVRDRDER